MTAPSPRQKPAFGCGNCASAAATRSGHRSWTNAPRRVCTTTVPPGPDAVKTIAR
ncbi:MULTISPECIES: hypothetical protein [unclassified Streptomyces]|uniref:hypothetical protein n=1 Tax=unclassified Streptomyces TaxID=2593676 RepID=UPI00131CC315|nr:MULTISPECIES: hypothetical protein [unclassified Streptomyces]